MINPPDSTRDTAADERFMREALALAARGGSWVSPNPKVGALVVRDGEIIGRGWHRRFGEAHAEINALHEAGAAARGATLYVTLEPCNHFGKTPPCSRAVIDAGIRTVVVGARDPNPIAGGGNETLRAAGITVISGVCEDACRELNAPFFKRIRTGLPFVTLKWAMTLDGRIATAQGESKWITGPSARAASHVLRAEHDAVLAGIGTLLKDNPLLNVRIENPTEPIRQPRRVILDSAARTPLAAALWDAPGAGPVIIFCAQDAAPERTQLLEERGAEIVRVSEAENGLLSTPEILEQLAARGIQTLLVEGGSRVLGSFVDAKATDQVYAFVAPKIFGGSACPGPAGGTGIDLLADALAVRQLTARKIGDDVLLHGLIGGWPWLS